MGNVTRAADGSLPVKPVHINDVNAIFEYKEVFHIMHQGAATWEHLTSADLVHWTRRGKVFGPPPKNSSWDKEAECDGSLSFPAGLGPRIMWTPNCGFKVAGGGGGVGAGDYAHLAVAEAADPADPLLLEWTKDKRNPCTGDIPSFPDSVWQSEVGDYYNMLGALNGKTPWARYTSNADLLVWKLADPAFATWANDSIGAACQKCCSLNRQPSKAAGGVSAPQWNRIPGAVTAGEPTHFINMAKGNAFALGTYNATSEHMTLTSCTTVTEGAEYAWTATGGSSTPSKDGGGRVLSVAWLWPEKYTLPEASPCVEALSMVRELRWDAIAAAAAGVGGTLISAPIPEYAALRNATLLACESMALSPGVWSPALPLGGGRGGGGDDDAAAVAAGSTSEIALALPLADSAATSLGVAVLSPVSASATELARSAIIWLNVSAPVDGAGGGGGRRRATLSLVNHHAPPVGNKTVVATQAFTVGAAETEVALTIFVDRVVIEAFAMGGRAEVVGEEYPPDYTSAIHLVSDEATVVQNLTVHGMGCGWAADLP